MKVKFWGVRGSIPTPGTSTMRYGGNTACLQVFAENDMAIICDAGTGIRECGLSLLAKKPKEIHLFISHTHWDHIHGFPFFVPAFIPGNVIHVYGPVHYEKTLKSVMSLQMDYAYFPVAVRELAAEIHYHDIREGTFQVGAITVRGKYSNHPVTSLGYRFEYEGKSLVYTGDKEPYYNLLGKSSSSIFGDDDAEAEREDMDRLVAEQNRRHVEFCRDADLLVHDAQYTEEEYRKKFVGWGHSAIETVINDALAANVKRVALFHHDPGRSDDQLDALLKDHIARLEQNGVSLKLFVAAEKQEIEF